MRRIERRICPVLKLHKLNCPFLFVTFFLKKKNLKEGFLEKKREDSKRENEIKIFEMNCFFF